MEIPQDQASIFTLLMSESGIQKIKEAFERAGIFLPEVSLTTELTRLQQDINYALLHATHANQNYSHLSRLFENISNQLDDAQERLTNLNDAITSRLDDIEAQLKLSSAP